MIWYDYILTFLELVGEAGRALERRRQIRILLTLLPFIPFPSSSILYLLGV